MNLGQPWEAGQGSGGSTEDPYLQAYHDRDGGLFFTEVNVAKMVPGSRERRLDAIRFPDEPEGNTGLYHYSSQNHETVARLIQEYPAELIEVHKWGFYVFGQLVGKSEIVWMNWNPLDAQPVLIPTVHESGAYYPDKTDDPATEAVFRKWGIDIVGLEPGDG